jgi:hypothetical protein
MSNSFIVQATKLGIVLEQNTAALAGANITGVGALYDGAADPTYAVPNFKTDVTIDSAEYEQETFQDVEDHYDHYINLRYNGSGSFVAKAVDETVAATLDSYNLYYAGLHLPNGDCDSAAGDLDWNGAGDVNAGVQASDLRGYAIAVEQQVGAAIFYLWVFHNCRIKVTPGRSPKQAMTVTVNWDDARTVEFSQTAATFTDHVDA